MPRELDDIALSRSPYRTILTLAWPQVLMTLTTFLIGAVDVWAAGRINSSVQASLGQITQLLMFFMVAGIAAANGAVAAISQSVGAGLWRRVRRYVGLCLELAAAFGALILVLGLAGKGLLLDALQTPEGIRPITGYFLDVYVLLLPPYYVVIIINAVFRAQKRVMIPLYCMIIITVCNTVGDLGFGLGWFGFPDLGYRGLAWSTFGSILAGALFNLAALRRLRMLTCESFARWRWVRCALPYVFRVAWPSGLMSMVWNLGYVALFALVASLPSGNEVSLAALTVGNRIEALLFLPALAFNLTAGILVGHALGRGDPAEAKRMGWRIAGIGVGSISLLTVLLWAFVRPVAAFFAPDPAVSAEAVNYLFYNLLAMPCTVLGMVIVGALNGAGATLYTFVAMGGGAWLIRIPLAWGLGLAAGFGPTGIWAAMLVSQVLQALYLLWVFALRNWPRFSLYAKRKETPHGASAS
ncbi:MAG: MATE family efflux transporter [Desulfovibrionaceae bacterium]